MTVATPEPMGSELAISDRQTRFSPAQRTALAHMGVDKAPDEDVDVFFHVCQRTKLDPFARQIYMIGRQESVMVNGDWTKQIKYTIQTGIDGYRTIARRTAKSEAEDLEYADMLWCGRDGVWHDVWLGEPQELVAAKATVIRNGKPFTHVALWREYVQTKRNGEPNTMWATKGANQLAKCAEAGALRKAYPQDYAGLYVDAELEHLANETAAANTVRGDRDWWADADAATDVDQLRVLWTDANRAGALTERLQQHIQQQKERLQEPKPPAENVVVDADVVDEKTGEVLTPDTNARPAAEPVGGGGDAPPIRRQTILAITRELERCGVDPKTVDAYLPVLQVPREKLADLTQDEGNDLLAWAKDMTRDQLTELMANYASAQQGAGS